MTASPAKGTDPAPGRAPALLAALLLTITGVVAGVVPAQAAPARVSTTLRAAVRMLPVAARTHAANYRRTTEFGTWITQYGQCDTRAVVLKQESLKATTQNRYCTVETGKWFSFYNGKYYYSAYGGALQIDHVVPVEDTWVSGAWRWTQATRVAYYNDLGDPRTLVAVDRHDNEAKGDQTPDTWMPPTGHCRYIRYYVAVKLRWRLTVTPTEKAALTHDAAACPNTTLTLTRASIHYR